MKMLILAAALVSGAAVSTSAQVTASAFADVVETHGGVPFRIGVWFEMEPGWHIYWKHPGDSGLPTEITATAPEGVEIGPWRFPVPERFGQPGDIAGFGYAEHVLLVADVTWPAVTDVNSLTIDLVADWLMCKDRCIPGRGEFRITVGVLPPFASLLQRPSAQANTFGQWEARMPDPADSKSPFDLNVDRSDGNAKLTLTWLDAAPRDVDWLPNPALELSIANVELTEHDALTTITFAWEKWGEPPSPTLNSLLSWTDPDGRRRGRDLSFTLY